jgi:putative ABC transport system ATP-binding protein
MSALAVRDVSVVFEDGAVRALAGVDLDVHEGATLALTGRSGSGKTTLLHVLSRLVLPTSGTVERNATTSLVFQAANLLPHFTALENVLFAQLEQGVSAGAEAERLLALVGLEAKHGHLPSELSGGEAQRTAIARALAQRPDVLLCDEPTGHLDSDTSRRILDLVGELREELGFGLVIATHDAGVAARCERVVELHDGRIVAERRT